MPKRPEPVSGRIRKDYSESGTIIPDAEQNMPDQEPTWLKVPDQTRPKSTTLLSVRSHTINILSSLSN
jgi:hypothetical protein